VSLIAASGVTAHPSAWVLAVCGVISGFAVGLTGMGGGALMTPLLVLVLKVDPKVAIASDLVSSLFNKPIGGIVHGRRGTVSWRMVGCLVAGSVPAAFIGAVVLNSFGNSAHVESEIKLVLGWALLVACLSLLAKALISRSSRRETGAEEMPTRIRPVPTVLVGIVGGFIVGMTSVGSGSVMIVLLMLLYPGLSAKKFVGTDLVQAIPLVASATLGQLLFGHVDFSIATSLTAGSIPGVYLGARFSSRAPDGIIRPILVVILAASALALLFSNDNTGFALAFGISLAVGLPLWAAADASLLPPAVWDLGGRDRTRWVALLGVGAPFGVGLIAAPFYLALVRRRPAPDRQADQPRAPW
jgi:uncharacterized protein